MIGLLQYKCENSRVNFNINIVLVRVVCALGSLTAIFIFGTSISWHIKHVKIQMVMGNICKTVELLWSYSL